MRLNILPNNLRRLLTASAYLIIFSLLAILFTAPAKAANVTWDGGGTDGTCGGNAGDGNKWSCGANWSTDSVPAAADVAIFNSTSTKDVTISANITHSAININSGYTGTITQNSGVTITLTSTSTTSAFTQASGTFLGGNADITISGGFTLSGGSFRSTSANFNILRNFSITGGTFTHNSGTLYFGSTSSTTAMGCNNTTLNSVVIRKLGNSIGFTIGSDCNIPLASSPQPLATITNSGTITVSGDLTIDGSYTSSGGSLDISGTTFTTTRSMTFTSGTISNSITTLVAGLNFSNAGNIINNGLNLSLLDYTLNNSTLNCGTATFNTVTIDRNNGITVTPASNCTMNNLDFIGGILGNPASSYTLSIAGNLNISPTVKSGTSDFGGANVPIVLNGSGTQYINQDYSPFKSPITISKSAGEAVLSTDFVGSNTQTCSISQGTLNLNGYNFYCSSTFTVSNGATLKLTGRETVTTPTLNAGSNVIYTGFSDSQTNTYSFNPFSYSNLTINSTETADTLDSRNTLSNGLVGYWKMEEGSGTTVDDSSSNSNVASLGGNAAFSSTKPTLTGETNNYSMAFDGTGDFLNPGSNLTIGQNLKETTITAWINKNDVSGQEQIFGFTVNGHTGNSRLAFHAYDGRLNCTARSTDSETLVDIESVSTVLTTGTWYHVACTMNFSKNQVSLYINGVPLVVDNEVSFVSSATDNTTSQNSSIGIDEDKAGGDFNGYIDEVRFYNRALNGREIQRLAAGETSTESSSTTISGNFNLTAGGFYPPSTLNVAGNWTNNGTFTHNSGTVVLNGSSQSLNGDTTFYNLTKTVAATDTLTFQANKTQTVANTLTLKGAADNLLSLRSSSNGTQWNIDPQSTRDIEYLDVKDSNNTNASEIAVNGLNITNSLNNTNWGFESGEPAIVLTPVSPDPTADSTPSVAGSATDADGTISLIEYQMDGTSGDWTACTADDGTFDEDSESFVCSVSPALTQGSHTIYVRATDDDLNVTPNEDAASDSFTIDIEAPVITIDAPTSPTNDNTPIITGNASDTLSNISSVDYQIDSTSGSWSSCSAGDGNFNSTAENFTCTISPALTDGNHIIYIRSADALSNITANEDAETEDFDVDTTAPTIPGTPSTTTPANDPTPTWQWDQSTDSISGLSTTTAYTMQWSKQSDFGSGVSTADVGTNNCNLGVCTYTTATVTNGTWYFRVKATDLVGNESSYSSSGTKFIDATDPSISLTPISPDPTTDTTPALTGSTTDANSLITAVQYQMDSTLGVWTDCTADDGTFDELSENFTCQIDPELTGGSHTIYVRAGDAAGNITGNIVGNRDTFSVDLSAPSITLTPYSPDPTSDPTPTLSGSATDDSATITNIQHQMNGTGGTWRNCTAVDGSFDEAAEDFTCTPISNLPDGNHTMYVRATDSTGNTTTNGSASTDSFTVDATAPTITLTPISPDPTNDDTPTISGSAVDATGTISNIRYQMNGTGGAWSNCSAGDGAFDESSESFSCTVSPALDDGSHTIYIQGIDALNNTTDNADLSTDSFILDTTSATITLEPFSSSSDTTPNISGNVVDSLLTIANAQYQMDGTGGSWNNCSADDGTFDEAAEDFTCSISSPLNDGSHTIYVRVTDSEGKTTSDGAAEYLTFNIDTTPPVVSVSPVSPDPTSDTTPSISGTATDALSLTVAVFLQIDGTGGAWTACTAADGSFEEASETFSCTAPTALADGSHTFYFRAIDSLNNTTNSSFTTDTFTVSTTGPAITLGTVSPDPTNDSTPSITGSAESLYSTVSNIQYQIDVTGGTWHNCSADDGTFDEDNEDFTCSVGSALSQGAHTIYIRATDALGVTTANDDLESDLFTVDIGGPSISVTALSPDPNGDNTPTFTGTASDIFSTINSVSYQVDGTSGSWSACTPNDSLFNSSTEIYNCTTTTLSDGAHTVYFRSVDSLGNITSSGGYATDSFTIDTTPPSTPGTPSAITSSDDSTPTWNWSESTDNGSGLSPSTAYTMQWSTTSDFSSGVSSGSIGTSSCSAGTCSYTHSVNLSNETWYFRVKAVDLFGRESSYSSNGSITISASADTQAPTGSTSINVGSEINAAYTNLTTATLSISASDDLTATDSLEMMISSDAAFSGGIWEAYATSKGFTLSGESGIKTIYIKFKDENENQSESYSDSILFDVTPPEEPRLENPDNESVSTDDKPEFKFKKASDAHSGIRKYQLLIDGETYLSDIDPDSSGNYIKVNIDESLDDGEHIWHVKAIDNAGNTRNSDEYILNIDTEKPNLQLTQIGDAKRKITSTSESGIPFTITSSKPKFIGSTEADASVSIKITPNDIECETTANGSGAWECTPNKEIENGTRYEAKITSIDEAGNETELPKVYIIKNKYQYETEIIDEQAQIQELESPEPQEPQPEIVYEPETNRYRLTIKVVDEKNQPIKNAKVTVFSEPQEAYTDENGYVYFIELPEGEHKVVIEHNNGNGVKDIELTGSKTDVKYEIMIMQTNNIPLWIWVLLAIFAVIILVLSYKIMRKKVDELNNTK